MSASVYNKYYINHFHNNHIHLLALIAISLQNDQECAFLVSNTKPRRERGDLVIRRKSIYVDWFMRTINNISKAAIILGLPDHYYSIDVFQSNQVHLWQLTFPSQLPAIVGAFEGTHFLQTILQVAASLVATRVGERFPIFKLHRILVVSHLTLTF